MDWPTPEDTVPSGFIPDAQIRSIMGKPPATGAWRDGDPVGNRQFAHIGDVSFENGGLVADVRIAYETFGTLNAARDNAILVAHALTGDSHLTGEAGPGHPTAGWWGGIVGPGKAIDTDRYFVVAPNMLGSCQGSTGPASLDSDGEEWGIRFPYTSIRDQVRAQHSVMQHLGIARWAAIVGGSMGGM